jgi:hypothetical protein
MIKRSQHFWIDAVLLALTVVSVAAAITVSELSPLTKDDLRLEIADLRSSRKKALNLQTNIWRPNTQTFFDSQAEQIKAQSRQLAQNPSNSSEVEAGNRDRSSPRSRSRCSSSRPSLIGYYLSARTRKKWPSAKNSGQTTREMEERMK